MKRKQEEKNMKILMRIVFMLLLITSMISISFSQTSSKYTKLNINGYSFEVSKTWEKASDAENEEFKMQLLYGIKDFARKYNLDVDQFSIPSISVFSAPSDNCIMMIYLVNLPDKIQSEEWLDILYEGNKEKIKLGVTQGIVKEIFRNIKTKINNIPVLVTDMKMVSGKLNRLITFIFHSPKLLSIEIAINIFSDSNGYIENKLDIDHFINSVEIYKSMR